MEDKAKTTRKKPRRMDHSTLRGRVTSGLRDKSPANLRVLAYATGTTKLLGSALTGEDGNFIIEFDHFEPVDVSVSVCPDVKEALLKVIPKASAAARKDNWRKQSPYTLDIGVIDIAVPMKSSVATMERRERLAMPQTPWPLVQPEPTRVPMPTSRDEVGMILDHSCRTRTRALYNRRLDWVKRSIS